MRDESGEQQMLAIAALRIADRCATLDDGRAVFTGLSSEVLASGALRREYLAI